MLVAVVYETRYGNTRSIAEAIAAGARDVNPAADVTCRQAAEAGPEPWRAGLLIVGAPTHFLGLPSRRSRVMQPRHGYDSGIPEWTGPQPQLTGFAGVREWLDRLPQARPGARAAAFDTRLDKLMSGSAARQIGRILRQRGYQVPTRPEGFTVAGFEGPVAEGELARARQWGADLAGIGAKAEAAPA